MGFNRGELPISHSGVIQLAMGAFQSFTTEEPADTSPAELLLAQDISEKILYYKVQQNCPLT